MCVDVVDLVSVDAGVPEGQLDAVGHAQAVDAGICATVQRERGLAGIKTRLRRRGWKKTLHWVQDAACQRRSPPFFAFFELINIG